MTYYYSLDYKVLGPVTAEQLNDLYRAGTITLDTQIVPEGSREWTTYHTLNPRESNLSTLVPPLAGVDVTAVTPPPPPPAPPRRQPEPAAPPPPASGTSRSYKGLVIASWILLAGIALVSLIPLIGFATWLIAVPIFIVTLILGIITLSRGGTRDGILILVATFVGVPLFIAIAPILTTAILGAAANTATNTEATPAATSTAASGQTVQSSSDQPSGHAVGETIKFADSEWVVAAAQDRGSTLPGGTFSEAKRSSGKFVMVKFTVTNTTNEEEQIIDTPKLVDSRGRKFEQMDDVNLYLPEGASEMTLEQLPSGIMKTFYAIFEVPADATGLAFETRSLGFNPDYIPVNLNL